MTVLQGSTVLGLRAEGKEAENGGGGVRLRAGFRWEE